MNTRERFHATCRFERPDRPIRYEALGFWDETIDRWHNEGLPETVIDAAFTAPDHFGFDTLSWLPIMPNTDYEPGLWPIFEETVIEVTDKYIIKTDVGGNTVKVMADGRSTIPQYLDHPVKTLKDFEALKWRLDPETPERYTEFLDPMCALAASYGDDTYTCAHQCGLFATWRLLMGLVGTSIAMRRDPQLLHAIAEHWVHLNEVAIKKVREKAVIDWVFFFEDMSYRNGPMISPRAFEGFMTPYYSRLMRSLRADTDITVFCADSDGDVSQLIPLFIEAGINMMLPFEVSAGMDVRKVREAYPDLVILGGLDKMALFGDETDIRAEVEERVPWMLRWGGYIPSLDHNVPPEVSLENFERLLDLVRAAPENG
ncbi:MAG: hypothetical protein JW885_08475 [Deltaproteobacteria bacterium]|nr:hypothetical protein [Candidatus Zymogenaceae bacterium]